MKPFNKESFSFNPIQCNVTGGRRDDILPKDGLLSVLLGRFPSREFPDEHLFFPINMSTEAMFPHSTSLFTAPNGNQYEVECSTSALSTSMEEAFCLDPFVPRKFQTTEDLCVHPCPVCACPPVISNQRYSPSFSAMPTLRPLQSSV